MTLAVEQWTHRLSVRYVPPMLAYAPPLGGSAARRTHHQCTAVRDHCIPLHRVDEWLEHREAANDGHVVAPDAAPNCREIRSAIERWGQACRKACP